MSTNVEGHINAGAMDDLRWRKCKVVKSEDHEIVVFYHKNQLYAVHNRCPHSGYGLNTGTVENGVVTCMWHQAEFDVATGESLSPELAGDIATFSVEVVDGQVWVNPEPNTAPAE